MESKQIEVQVGKVLCFKPRVGKVKTGQTTSEYTVISPYNLFLVMNSIWTTSIILVILAIVQCAHAYFFYTWCGHKHS